MQLDLTLAGLVVGLMAISTCAAFGQQDAPAPNIVANGSFEEAGEGGVARAWSIEGVARTSVTDAEAHEGERSQLLVLDAGQHASLQQTVEVKPHTTYLFSAWVHASGRVVARAGGLAMSYHRQGQWQKLVGVVRSDDSGTIDVSFACRPLDATPARAWIDDVALHEAGAPEAPQREALYAQTRLVEDGTAAATIIYPSGSEHYRALAQRAAAAVQRATGVPLPVVADTDATQQGPPVLRDELRGRNLVLLGRLGINRAMWPAYNRFLCAVDGYYPGGDGYVVRTATNVFRNGRNHIILGGSTDAGAERAVGRFLELLPDVDDDGSLTLPWLLDVDLQGECRTAFEERDALWRESPEDPALPPFEPGYETVRRWYENAMGWYWSGWDGYRQRALKHLDLVLADRAYTHHYLVEFLVRTWQMIGDSPIITAEQRHGLDSLILQNFWDFLLGSDLRWMRVFSPPYDDVTITSRHQIAPLMADIAMAQFLDSRLPLEGEIGDLVRFRLSEKRAFMDHMVEHRWGPSAPGAINGSGCHEEIVASMFRYALEYERYGFFESGNARRALHLDMIDHRGGRLMRPVDRQDTHLLLGILAHYHNDGRYLRLMRTLPHEVRPTGYFQGRYVNEVHRYVPGAELTGEAPDELAGLRLPETMPHVLRDLDRLARGRYRRAEVDPESILDFIAFRGGFDLPDDYLAISGLAMHCAPGAILTLSSHGAYWLRQASDSYFGQNGLHVLRLDRITDDPAPYPAAATLDWHHELEDGGAVSLTLEPFGGTQWRRSVVWIDPGLFIVRDTVSPLESGEYMVVVNWHPNGTVSPEAGSFRVVNGSRRMRVSPLGDGLQARSSHERQQYMSHIRISRSGALEADETVTITTVLQVSSGSGATEYVAAMPDTQQVTLTPETGGAQRMVISWAPQAADGPPIRVERVEAAPAAGEEQPVLAAADQARAEELPDRTARWRTAWQYEGLLRPARVHPVRRVSEEVVDLGRVVELDEIRVTHRRGKWYPAKMPETVEVAVPDDGGAMPPPDGPGWREIDVPVVSRPGVHTDNYGEAHPVPDDYQALELDGLPARWVRAAEVDLLAFYERGRREARRPLHLDVADLTGAGEHVILVRPPSWPKFIRLHTRGVEDDALALLDPSGDERLQFEPEQDVQAVRLVDWLGTGRRQLLVATVDARIHVFDADGTPLRTMDLYEMHQHFNETEGRPNTRHPAGGFTMPYSMGLWRRGPDGAAKIVVSRYCAFSFLDERGEFEGVLHAGGYVTPELLPEGLDFDGDGRDEQVCLSRGTVWRISGSSEPHVAEPEGELFYPQVYRAEALREPAWSAHIDGPRTFVFEPVRGEDASRHVLVVRQNYVGMYDGREHRWTFTWAPLVDMTAATSRQSEDGLIEVLAVTRDGVLWTFRWDGDPEQGPERDARPIAVTVTAMAAGADGELLLATPEGLVLERDGRSGRILDGAFTDVALLGRRAADGIIAARDDGRIIRLDPAE
ncbi:MAG: hypothetical protein U9R79_09520 [Armatimonadota bacterium]|nr:hypothetical protein [Armatimonadota bacterium]